jgi:hypothetical protein
MPRKEFVAFTRLDASDVNTYLMDQSVMTFATSAARTTAIPTPAEGMVTYLEDSNSLQVWDGTAWTLAGGVSSGNAIINGAFEINQRNFTSTTSGGYGFDRWTSVFQQDGTVTYSAQAFTPGSAPLPGFESANYARIVTSGQSASNAAMIFGQLIENVRSFAGQTVTISFFARSGSGTPKISVEIDQRFGSGGSPSSPVITYAGQPTLSTSWARYSITVAVPSISGKTIGSSPNTSFLGLSFWISAGSDFNARTNSLGIQNNTFDIWGVQLEGGPVATPFRRNANSIQGELAACQRYYYRTGGTTAFEYHGLGSAGSTTQGRIMLIPKQTMRVGPTSIEFGNLGLYDSNSTLAVTTCTLDQSATNSVAVVASVTSGLTQFRPYSLISNNNANGFVALSAEL